MWCGEGVMEELRLKSEQLHIFSFVLGEEDNE
jgi:hypothetical protein